VHMASSFAYGLERKEAGIWAGQREHAEAATWLSKGRDRRVNVDWDGK
jgi:hypothetical protein